MLDEPAQTSAASAKNEKERKLAEEALRESERRTRELIQALPVAIYTCDARGYVTLYNEAAVALWGRKPEIGKDLWCGSWRIYEFDGTPLPLDRCPMALAIQEGRSIRGKEIVIERPDGTRCLVLPYPEPIRSASGEVIGAVNMLVDLTEHKEADEARARLAAIVDSSDDAIVSKTLEGIITSWNRGAERIFGYMAREAVGRHIFLIIPEELRGEEEEVLARIRRGDRIDHFQTIRRGKDGRKIDISLTVSPVKDSHGRVIGASKVARDITDSKKAERQLKEFNVELERRVAERTAELKSANLKLVDMIAERVKLDERVREIQKLQTMGELAAGIAHDFNNILGIIRGYSTLLPEDSSDPDKLSEDVRIIGQAVQRGAGVVRQLLTFAQKADVTYKSLDVNDVVEDLVKMLKETFPRSISFALKLDREIPSVIGDSNQLYQALLNLCVNARDAMPEGGRLSITTEGIKRGGLQLRFPEAHDVPYVHVAVADIGTGIDRHNRHRIFEPFFTTKGPGKGSGLGLAVVYGIVKSHRGFVHFACPKEGGTIFHLYLPGLETDGKSRASDVRRPQEEELQGDETILLVEDEEAQCRLMQSILEKNGYRVLTAQDGFEAVEKHLGHKTEISAVVLDLGLPKLNGWEVFLRMKENDPKVKTIFATGYVDPKLKSQMLKARAKDVIHKPYLAAEVLAKVREVIERP